MMTSVVFLFAALGLSVVESQMPEQCLATSGRSSELPVEREDLLAQSASAEEVGEGLHLLQVNAGPKRTSKEQLQGPTADPPGGAARASAPLSALERAHDAGAEVATLATEARKSESTSNSTSTDCSTISGGTCMFSGCDQSRGATYCNSVKMCMCSQGYCANEQGVCLYDFSQMMQQWQNAMSGMMGGGGAPQQQYGGYQGYGGAPQQGYGGFR
ncbi:unnamed protein product [Polarella glacialis]|uniref:Uncharacterized protein n=1 Tax=Polarella glacialis TaxID=89957 RepID=A0A813G4T2_POLGL|nr:unnamed protein product [Polarella glacialis]CAE8719187.1 unnamed protein product [Polarella glacialis]